MLKQIHQEKLPTLSIIIPTYNEEKHIKYCLDSIFAQDYPKDKIEVLLVDGMSSDNTVRIAKSYSVRVIFNKNKLTGNARKLGAKEAKNDILVYIDADYQLPRKNWLRLMIQPLLDDVNIAGTLTLILPKKNYPAISRFFALEEADPFVTLTYATGRSTNNMIITQKNFFPTGANVLRKELVLKIGNFKPYLYRLEDVDLAFRLLRHGYKLMLVKDAGMYHLYVDSFSSFLKKTYRRILTFVRFDSANCDFQFMPKEHSVLKFLKEMFLNALLVGALVRVGKGIRKHPDTAWLYYPLIYFSELMMYSIVFLTDEKGRKMLKSLIRGT